MLGYRRIRNGFLALRLAVFSMAWAKYMYLLHPSLQYYIIVNGLTRVFFNIIRSSISFQKYLRSFCKPLLNPGSDMDGHVTCDNDTIKLSDCFSFAFSRNQFVKADVLLCFNIPIQPMIPQIITTTYASFGQCIPRTYTLPPSQRSLWDPGHCTASEMCRNSIHGPQLGSRASTQMAVQIQAATNLSAPPSIWFCYRGSSMDQTLALQYHGENQNNSVQLSISLLQVAAVTTFNLFTFFRTDLIQSDASWKLSSTSDWLMST